MEKGEDDDDDASERGGKEDCEDGGRTMKKKMTMNIGNVKMGRNNEEGGR